MSSWQAGNAEEEGTGHGGWFVGAFLPPAAGIRAQGDVEVKWARHRAGEARPGWTTGDQRTALVVLVDGGPVRVDTTEGSVTLVRQGDYVMWGPGVDHSWSMLGDSVVMTVRWPSQPEVRHSGSSGVPNFGSS